MATITIQEAQTCLAELVHQLKPGTELIITHDHKPVARLIGIVHDQQSPRPRPAITGIPKAGQYEGRLVVPDEFDEPLEELGEYVG